jgi:urea transport system substrate-binding protein
LRRRQIYPNRTLTRRDLLSRGGQAAALLAAQSLAQITFSGCSPSAFKLPSRGGKKPIKVGILHSQTGNMSISETSLRDAEMMAIEEINAAGGIFGNQIEAVVEDGRSRDADIFPRKARKLLLEDKVAAVFGCWTSLSRKSVLPIFEQQNGILFYPLVYEGNESSPNIVYTGSAANQQVLPAVDWLLSPAGGSKKRFYLVGSDYDYCRTVNYLIVTYLQTKGLQVLGVHDLPLGYSDFKVIVQQIKTADPDVIFSTINGESNVHFYNELVDQGITADKLPVVATCVGEDELRYLLPSKVEGHLSAWHYFQSIDTPKNKEFIEKFQREHGWDRVTDDPIEAAYSQVYLWKAAVEKAGSTDADEIREAFRGGIEFEAPGGRIKVDPKTQHTYKWFRMGRVRDDRQFDIIYESPSWIEPEPYPQVAFPGWRCDWTKGGVTRGVAVEIPMMNSG